MTLCVAASAALLSLSGRPSSDGAAMFVLDPALDGRCDVVVAADAIPAEKTAANLLVRHLAKMLPEVSFPVVAEDKAAAGKRIYVGSTKALAAAGLDTSGWDVEEELIAVRKEGLFIAGGRPRGARYAAADFLEVLGVVVAADDTQVSPRLNKLEWSHGDVRRRPAFRARYTATPGIRQRYLNEFNKYNGYRLGGEAFGGYAAYGKYGDCHTFVGYSMEFPRDVPEVFAFSRGKRLVPPKDGMKSALCPSNPKTLELFMARLEADVKRSMSIAERGLPRPLYYEISMDDALTICECPTCCRIAKDEGCYAGVMLQLINPLARRLSELDPEAKMSMLVYQKTLEFPKVTKPEPNVLPRICVHDNEWIVNVKAESVEPISASHNDAFRKTFEDWAFSAKSFGVWEYWEYYTKGAFPCISPRAYVENMRYYKAHGAENLLVEMEHETQSFYAFKNWLALKLMDNPRAKYDRLADTFFSAYYGAAAGPMRKYLDFLAESVEKEAAKAPMGPRGVKTYEYLDFGFFSKAYVLLAEAEAAAAGDERSLQHARSEYAMLDRTLLRGDKAQTSARLGLDKKRLIDRIRRSEAAHLKNLYDPRSDALKDKLRRLDNFLTGESIDAPVPTQVKGDSVFDYKFNSFYVGPTTRVVDDKDALGGRAVEVWCGKDYALGRPFHALPFTAGVYNAELVGSGRSEASLKLSSVPQDEKYHLYHLGKCPLVSRSRLWLHWTWYFQFHPRDAYSATPDYESDVWVSLKFTGPTYVKGSTLPDGIFVDRVIFAR